MALRFMDGADHYSTGQITRKWTTMSGGTILAAGGRRGTNALGLGNTVVYTKVLDNQATWIVGFCLKISTLTTFGTGILCALTDAGTEQVSLRMDATGHLIVSRAGTTLATSVAMVAVGESYIEWKITISDAAGTYDVRLNNVSILSGSAVDTKNTANAFANTIKFGDSFLNSAAAIDDIYVCDGTGAAPNNTFLGDVRVDATYPVGVGANSGMTPIAGANWTNVDENPANDDTDYVSSAVAATKDTYDCTNITHNPTAIYGVMVTMVARKDDAGARSICSVTRSGGTDNDGATQALSTTYAHYTEIVALDPNGAIAWTKTNLNAAEFGSKVAA
jgi:hypothetical protein